MNDGTAGTGRWRWLTERLLPPTRIPAAPLLETGQIAMLCEALGQEGWEEAVADFAVTTEDEIARLHRALEQQVGVRRAAHTLKGVALNMGANRLALLAARIEKADAETAGDLAEGLADALDATVSAMRALPVEAD